MANTKQILALLKSKSEGNDEQFYSIALQIAASEARQGHRHFAEELRSAVDEARASTSKGASVAIPFAQPRGDLHGLVDYQTPRYKLSDIILHDSVSLKITDFLRQQIKRGWLREHGKVPNRRVLFVGPPGAGKTMTAEALAEELKLPFFIIRLEGLITRYMGETAAKLRLVFDQIAKARAVYLFDEFDAVGSERNASNDVAEMRRVLNSFLQFMEEPNSTDSIIIGATNYPELLDHALLRRFDLILKFEHPTSEQVKHIIRLNLRPMKYPRLAWKKIVAAADGLSQSEITRATEDAVKTAILDERSIITTEDLIKRLDDRVEMSKTFTNINDKM